MRKELEKWRKNEIVNKKHAGNACIIVNKNVSNENVESGKLPLTPTPLRKKVEESGKGSREKGQPKKEREHIKQKSSTDYMEKSIAEIPIGIPPSSEIQSTSVCLEPTSRW